MASEVKSDREGSGDREEHACSRACPFKLTCILGISVIHAQCRVCGQKLHTLVFGRNHTHTVSPKEFDWPCKKAVNTEELCYYCFALEKKLVKELTGKEDIPWRKD